MHGVKRAKGIDKATKRLTEISEGKIDDLKDTMAARERSKPDDNSQETWFSKRKAAMHKPAEKSSGTRKISGTSYGAQKARMQRKKSEEIDEDTKKTLQSI